MADKSKNLSVTLQQIPRPNLVCIAHRDYQGDHTPNILCKACCTIYVQFIKSEIHTKNKLRGTWESTYLNEPST